MRFLLYFDRLQPVHLYKEMGMVTFYCKRNFGWDSQIATIDSRNNEGLAEFRGVPIRHFESEKSFRFWLEEHAKEIDLFCVIEATRVNARLIRVYKKHNPTGVAYLKLDLNDHSLGKYLSSGKANIWHEWRRDWRLHKYQSKLRHADLVSVETKAGYDRLLNIFSNNSLLSKKLFYMPNGFDLETVATCSLDRITFDHKDDILITVGRIGTHQKNTELLLEALTYIEFRSWKVCIIGTMAEGFHSYLDRFFQQYPHLKENILFVGEIADKCELYRWYARAKAFCLTSRWEGFPLVFPEALYFGHYLVVTDVSGAKEVTNNEQIGRVVTNVVELKNELQSLFDGHRCNSALFESVREHAVTYYWDNVISSLFEKYHELRSSTR